MQKGVEAIDTFIDSAIVMCSKGTHEATSVRHGRPDVMSYLTDVSPFLKAFFRPDYDKVQPDVTPETAASRRLKNVENTLSFSGKISRTLITNDERTQLRKTAEASAARMLDDCMIAENRLAALEEAMEAVSQIEIL